MIALEKRIPKYVKHVAENYPPGFKYHNFAPLWTAERFNATDWADLVEQSGARFSLLDTFDFIKRFQCHSYNLRSFRDFRGSFLIVLL